MRYLLVYSVLLVVIVNSVTAQVGINTTDPDALLDVRSSNQVMPSNTDGILIPKVDEFPITNPTVLQDGMMVFVTGNGTPTKGFYYWDQSIVNWISFRSSNIDHDWYKLNTTAVADTIADNIYTLGNVSIGAVNSINTRLYINDTINATGITINKPVGSGSLLSNITGAHTIVNGEEARKKQGHIVDINGPVSFEATVFNGSIVTDTINSVHNFITGTKLRISGNSDREFVTGLENRLTNTGQAWHRYGVENILSGDGSIFNEIGIKNDLISVSSINKIGVQNRITDDVSTQLGIQNILTSGVVSNRWQYGESTSLNTDGSGWQYGNNLSLVSSGNGLQYGYNVTLNTTGSGSQYGSHHIINKNGNSSRTYSTYNDIRGNGGSSVASKIYGVYNTISNTGLSEKYGSYTKIADTIPGTHYGYYSDVINSNGYAGYFLGRVSLGSTGSNNYIMPLSRGTANQVMQIDGLGNVNWIDPNTLESDDQNLTAASLTGNTLQIGIENGTSASVDLSSLGDNLGNHTATTDLNMSTSNISNVNFISTRATSDYDKLRVWNTGNFTIGLHSAMTYGYLNGTAMTFTMNQDANRGWIWRDTADSQTDGAMSLTTDGRMTLKSNLTVDTSTFSVNATTNRVGIGTTNPSTSLHINHPNGATTQGIVISNTVDTDEWRIYQQWNSNTLSLFFNNTNVGNFDDVSGIYTPISDKRLKKNITPLNSILDNLQELKVVNYKFNQQKDNRNYVGLLAQDVQEVFPHLVYQNSEQDNQLTMDYSGFGVLAIKAIQEQQESIDSQQEEIDLLKKEIEFIKSLIKND